MVKREEEDHKYVHELDILLREIKSFSVAIFEFYKTYDDNNSIRFVRSSAFLMEHIDQGILPYLDYFINAARTYDYSEEHPANGYRSLVGLIEKCCIHLLTLIRYIALKKKNILFRADYYSKEFESYVSLLSQLRACMQYSLKFMSCSSGHLISDKVTGDQFKLMVECESLSQEPFYGSCLGFQTITIMHVILASYSSGYNKSSPLMKLASSLLNSGKFILSPEERAKKVIEATVFGDVNFCKSFWDLAENNLLQSLSKVVSPQLAVEKSFQIPPEPVRISLSSDPTQHITVSPSHVGGEPTPLNVRLFSHPARQGQIPTATNQASDCLIIHCHGGGFVAQSSASHSLYLRSWAIKINVPILSIDYSLSPEYPYPRQVEEIFHAYCWALNNLSTLGTTGHKICFVGDSAGATLVTSTVLRTIHEGVRVPDGLLSVYGCFLVSYAPTPSRLLALMDPILPLGLLPKCLQAYIGLDKCKEGLLNKNNVRNSDDDLKNENNNKIRDISNKDDNHNNQSNLTPDLSPTNENQPNRENFQMSSSSIMPSELKNEISKIKDDDDDDEGDDDGEGDDNDHSDESTDDERNKFPNNQIKNNNNNINTSNNNNNSNNNVNNNDYNIKKKMMIISKRRDRRSLSTTSSTTSLKKISTSSLKKDLSLMYYDADTTITTTNNDVFEQNTLVQIQDYAAYRNFEVDDYMELRVKMESFKDPFLSPILASHHLLSKLCPVHLIACKYDPLLDESIQFAKKAKEAGVKVDLHLVDDLPHGFLNFKQVSKEAAMAADFCAHSLKVLLGISEQNTNNSTVTIGDTTTADDAATTTAAAAATVDYVESNDNDWCVIDAIKADVSNEEQSPKDTISSPINMNDQH